jgi:hypothetical protein
MKLSLNLHVDARDGHHQSDGALQLPDLEQWMQAA